MLIVKDTELGNPYETTLMVGRRARDITDGKPVILEPKELNAVTQATKEYLSSVISVKKGETL